MTPKESAPRSVSGWADPFILIATILGSYYFLSPLPFENWQLSALIVGISIVVMGVVEFIRVRGESLQLSLREALPHATVTWLGTLAGAGVVGLAWSLLTEYHRTYHAPFFHTVLFLAPFAGAISAIVTLWTVRRLGPTERGNYQLGLLLLGRGHEITWSAVRDALIVWFIWGFFLPVNFSSLVSTIGVFRGHELTFLSGTLVQSEYYLLLMVYALIIAAVTPGYIFGSRLINTNSKEVSNWFFAWIVTLVCYAPLNVARERWLDYQVAANPSWAQPWVTHLVNIPTLLVSIGVIILLSELIHLWSEAQFGLRSSNLANRGIITTGAYRFCKHPVYVSKCIGWFFIWMPFVAGATMFEDIRLTLLFFALCTIFALRALAEERLLSSDPTYVAYALWIDKHGLFKKFGKLVPVLSYSWRLSYWKRTGIL